MIVKFYCMFDIKAGLYHPAGFFRTEVEAVRKFEEAVKQVPQLRDHPEDYELYYICDFDDVTAIFSSPSNQIDMAGVTAERKLIARALSFVDKPVTQSASSVQTV